MEGNTLVLKQVEQLLNEGRAVGNKELSGYLEVRGYADAAAWVLLACDDACLGGGAPSQLDGVG